MEQNKKLKLFISYSHLDNGDENPYIEQFKKHIVPLKDKGLIEDWYDREILPGKDYQKEIDNNLEDADIICLFISADFLSSILIYLFEFWHFAKVLVILKQGNIFLY